MERNEPQTRESRVLVGSSLLYSVSITAPSFRSTQPDTDRPGLIKRDVKPLSVLMAPLLDAIAIIPRYETQDRGKNFVRGIRSISATNRHVTSRPDRQQLS